MSWPFKKRTRSIEVDAERLRADIHDAEILHREALAKWTTIVHLRNYLVRTRERNGFGEALEVAMVPRRRSEDDEHS